MKVSLFGTGNDSKWRERLIEKLSEGITYFDPRVEDWTEDDIEEEYRQKEICDYNLYTITPAMTGVFTVAEVVDDSNKRPQKTILCILEKEADRSFDIGQMKSLLQMAKLVVKNGARAFTSLERVATFLNTKQSIHYNSVYK